MKDSSENSLGAADRGGHGGPPVQGFSMFGAAAVAAMRDSSDYGGPTPRQVAGGRKVNTRVPGEKQGRE